jgi:hypothetical protein
VRSNAHTRPPHRLNGVPKAGRVKSRGRHGSFPHYAHRPPNFTGDRSQARGYGTAHAALPSGLLCAVFACWCAPDGFAARKRRGGTQGAATPEGVRRGGPLPAWSSLMGLLRPHRIVAPEPRAPPITVCTIRHNLVRAFNVMIDGFYSQRPFCVS